VWELVDVPREIALRADRDTLRALIGDRKHALVVADLLDEEARVLGPDVEALRERAAWLRS
jgi:hypothetical protein